ncbi:MAG TPA: hypothetical protein VMR89_09555 [Actinomycetota bacterium]|nr:hypothetical protein [Actinomycetota bacterium]
MRTAGPQPSDGRLREQTYFVTSFSGLAGTAMTLEGILPFFLIAHSSGDMGSDVPSAERQPSASMTCITALIKARCVNA